MTQEEYVGAGAIRELRHLLARLPGRRVFLVTGKHSYEASGAKAVLENSLRGKEVMRFMDFSPNPELADVRKGIAKYKEFSPDVVVAVGGGSAMDTAKAVNALSAEEGDPSDYLTGKKGLASVARPLIAIPTTSGSGSEATHFAVVYVKGIKHTLAHPSLLPRFAIVDPSLTYSLTRKEMAPTGADALCQAIESYWSVRSTDESKTYAREALALSLANLKNAVEGNRQARDAMSRAAHLAGKAINISRTTACHALAYPFTVHLGIPHGNAVALTLGSTLLFNSEVSDATVADPRGAVYVQSVIGDVVRMLGVQSPAEAKSLLDSLFCDIGLPMRLSDMGATKDFIGTVLKEASIERMKNNPRILTEENARAILEELLRSSASEAAK